VNLTDFRVLSFDCYGTLIDWESGIFDALQPLVREGNVTLSRDALLHAFARHEAAQQAAAPRMLYAEVLAAVHRRLAQKWDVAMEESAHDRFGASVPDWPEFPDTVAALRYLKQHYKLVILSNVDRLSFEGSLGRLRVPFDAVYTAEDIGSYKPNPANFRFMLQRLAEQEFPPSDILHTAQSLFHDHVPAKQFGLATAWINRRHAQPGWGATMAPPEGASYDFHFNSLAEMVEAHQALL
jgi:2-haloalkanoic acid dehalogenase type II